MNMRQSSNALEKELFKAVDSKTPSYIKENKLVNIENKNEFTFKLKREHLLPYDENTNPEGLGLNDWLDSYAKEAAVSTAGIRGPQNILYPYDTRFPINMVGIMLATEAKALVAKDLYGEAELIKLAGREVRYNSAQFLDLIVRIQAAHGIKTIVPEDRKTIPIWMASFLAFKLDLLGGEYITSSHGISVKNATKDLNSQGSQYLPEESMLFVNKIRYIFSEVEKNGYYDIKIAADNSPLISDELMKKIEDGTKLYVQYLKDGVAKDSNLGLIKDLNEKIVVENVGGSAYRTLNRILKELGISEKYDWFNQDEDPFFHSIGKYDTDPKGHKTFYDYSVDATVLSKDLNGKTYFPVIKSMHYDEKLKHYPLGTVVLITDPDHDRLTICQIEEKSNLTILERLGIDYTELDKDRILTVYTANQSFLMIMDFWANQLKREGLFEKHPRFIIKTTASARSWDEWAKNNGINVVNVPVGFKEIANIMKKVEKQISENPQKSVVITDIFNRDIDLGVNPKLIFGGEESGGMIIGSESLIKSQAGRIAIAMREKSATEAIIVASALVSYLEKDGKLLSDYLNNVFEQNNIVSKFDIREDISYYNESEPDIEKLKADKKAGEQKRTKNDLFYLTMAVAKDAGVLSLNQIREILASTFADLSFENLTDVKFVGDGTYMEFEDKFIEIRPSGTDAKTKSYGAGADKNNIKDYARIMGNYSGDLNEVYRDFVDMNFYNTAKEKSLESYAKFTEKDANNLPFVLPDYKTTLSF